MDKSFRIYNEAKVYKKVGSEFTSHESVNHSTGEYASREVTTNSVESRFALLERSLIGTFQHVSEQHLQCYATEFDFRWNTQRKVWFC
ncbi:transposase [Nitrosomonas sp.]|uniref:transposase n=1 Tax=Nitrosomonas sp. TaxID=42353 RepID=UPI00351F942E